eukprot:CAMPEP_0194397626 /NCGR_PEP_ID=MMETSP0174-20130528/125649_1 /TAXON_ID=216777 /ORGANISM="Proboscia alata, Strain PI-D3" /LENGTH=94 /DNA_ID=CAMNT_0039193825 /DNA_START=1511 /DNA_END=1794 /DNA_ORIENTATION=-
MSEAGQHARGSEAGAEVGRFDELVGLDQGVRLHTHGSDSEQASAGRVPAVHQKVNHAMVKSRDLDAIGTQNNEQALIRSLERASLHQSCNPNIG